MRLSEKLTPSMIKMELESEDKDELFEEMVTLFMREGLLPDRRSAVEALRQRESKMSTGVVKWVGFPHGRLPGIHDVVVGLGISRRGIEYESLDHQPVHVVVMVFSEAGNPGPHIELFSELSRLFSSESFTKSLCRAGSAEEVLKVIKSEE